MKRSFVILFLLGATFLHSCRDTEVNTDGDMEKNETEVGTKKDRPTKKYLAVNRPKFSKQLSHEGSKMSFLNSYFG